MSHNDIDEPGSEGGRIGSNSARLGGRRFSFTRGELRRTTSERTSWGEGGESDDGGGGAGGSGTGSVADSPVVEQRRRSDVEKKAAVKTFLDSSGHDVISDLKNGGPDKIVEIMLKQIHNARVQADGCEALTNLAHNDQGAQNEIGQRGGIHVTVCALKEHPKNSNVQEKGIAALCSLTLIPSNRAVISKADGAQLAINAMHQFADFPQIQVEASTLLANVAFGSRENKLYIGKNGGITAVLRAMDKFQDDSTMQTRSCLALRNIAWETDENKQLIGSSGGIAALVRAVQNHHRVTTIVEQSTIALCNIVLEHEVNQQRLLRARGIQVLLIAMQGNLGNEVIQEHCVSLLGCVVALSDSAAEAFADASGPAAIIRTMKLHMGHEGILLKTSVLIRHLLTNPDFGRQLYQLGAMELLAEAVCATLRDLMSE